MELVELKEIELPQSMQRAMAREAADVIAGQPIALQLRNLQILAEIAIEKNSTIIFPAQFLHSVRAMQQFLQDEEALASRTQRDG